MNTRRRLLLLAALLMLGGCGKNGQRADGSGTIECRQVDLSFLVPGRIAELKMEEGDTVCHGAIVARLDSRDHELRRGEARAALGAAQAQLDLLLAGARAEDVQRAAALVKEAEALAEAAKADIKRVQVLFQKGSATEKQMDDAKAQADRTAAALAAAQQVLAKVEKGNREEEIQLGRAKVEQALAAVAVAEKALADCALVSPADGTITAKIREEGESVSTGASVLTVSCMDDVWLSVYVPEDRLFKVKLGHPAWVCVDGDPSWHEGKVTFVSPLAEFTPRNVQTPDERVKLVYRVKIGLKNPAGVFKPGMPADGYFAR